MTHDRARVEAGCVWHSASGAPGVLGSAADEKLDFDLESLRYSAQVCIISEGKGSCLACLLFCLSNLDQIAGSGNKQAPGARDRR